MILKLGKLWFNSQFRQAIIKVWSTFEKVVGVGKVHNYFSTFFRDEGFVLRVLLE